MLRIWILCLIFLAATSTAPISLSFPISFSYGSVSSSTPSVPPAVVENRDAITFTGDLMLARRVETMLDAYGSDYVYDRLPVFASSTDWVITNFEAAVPTRHVHTPDLTFRFSVDAAHLSALRTYGVTHASLANNHSYDTGTVGFTETYTALHTANITPFGDQKISSSSVQVVNAGGVSVALVALYAVDVTPDFDDVSRLLSHYQATDYQIAYIHWGGEYAPVHMASTEMLAAKLVSLGFDAIIGHHPHVVQDIGYINGVPVFYSLGNFIFDQYFSAEVQTGLLVRLIPSSAGLTFELLPHTSLDSRTQPRLMNEAEKSTFLRKLAAKSDPTLRDDIEMGVVTIPRSEVANSQ